MVGPSSGTSAILAKVLADAAARVRLRRGVQAWPKGAIAGGVVSLALLAAAKTSVLPEGLPQSDWTIAVVALVLAGGGAGLAFAAGYGRRISELEMAQILDRRYGLAERIVTGWEIAARGPADEVEERAVEAACEAARRADPRGAIPLPPPRGSEGIASLISLVLPILLAVLLPAWVPPYVQQARAEKQLVKEAGKQLEKELASLATPTPAPAALAADPPTPTPAPVSTPDGNDPAEKMKSLARKMQEGEIGKREAMKELAALDKEMARKQAQAAKNEASRALARAASRLEEQESTKNLGKALQGGEAEQIRKEAEELAKKFDEGGFERRQQGAMADDLEALADALEKGGDPQAASELREAAKALRKGDLAAAKEHLEKADLASAQAQAREADPIHDMAQALQENVDTRQAGKAMDQGSLEKMKKEFSELADKLEKGELGADGEKRLQETLGKAARQGQSQGKDSTGGQIAQPLEKAARSLAAGNKDGAAEALRDLARQAAQAQAQSKQTGKARAALSRARQRLSGPAGRVERMKWGDQGDGACEGEGEGQGEGQGEGVGQGQGQGQGKGRGKGRGKGTPQEGRHVAEGSEESGTEAGTGTSRFQDHGYDATGVGPQRDRQSDRQSDWRKDYEQAYRAARTNDAKLGDTKVSGQMTAGASEQVEVEGDPGRDKGKARAGWVDVPAGYREAAEEAVGNEEIPAEHRARVKAYFEALSGQGAPDGEQDGAR